MLKRVPLALLLVVQALGGGAVTLAHARDVVAAPPGVEARHDARCAILHDEMRCALCHYAGARMAAQEARSITAPAQTICFAPSDPVLVVAALTSRTAPARAPPLVLS